MNHTSKLNQDCDATMKSLVRRDDFYNMLLPFARSGILQHMDNTKWLKRRHCAKCTLFYECRIGTPQCYSAQLQYSICKDCSSFIFCKSRAVWLNVGCVPPQERKREALSPELLAFIVNEMDEKARQYLCEGDQYLEDRTLDYFLRRSRDELTPYSTVKPEPGDDDAMNNFIRAAQDPGWLAAEIMRQARRDYDEFQQDRAAHFNQDISQYTDNVRRAHALQIEALCYVRSVLLAISPIILLPPPGQQK